MDTNNVIAEKRGREDDERRQRARVDIAALANTGQIF
jgi:hypothetical protein